MGRLHSDDAVLKGAIVDGIDTATTFPELFSRVVSARREHPALIAGGRCLTYEQLDAASARMARALLAAGAGKGTRIAILAPDGEELLTAFYAALRIGALVTPVSTLATPPELAHVLRTSDAQHLIAARRFLNHDFAADLEAALPGLGDAVADRLALPGAPYLRSVWMNDADELTWARPVTELLDGADGEPDAELLVAVEAEVSPGDDAFVVYTSGSTATPKAVVHAQGSVVSKPRALVPIFAMTPDDRTLSLLPAFWLGGIAAALQVLCSGSTLLYPTTPGVDDVLDVIESHDVTYVVVWHMLAKLRAAASQRGIDVDHIRGLSRPRDRNGDPIPAGLRANLLGMSESFSAHSAEPIDRRLPTDKKGSSGRAVNGIERRVVDPETGIEVPAGNVGELQIRGGGTMTGFYKVDPAEVFTPDGFYPTKDLVRIDTDGYLWFEGRTGDMIKTSSANVSRLEVEAAMNELTDVSLALVTGIDDRELGEMVVAAVVPAPGCEPGEDELRQALRGRLSSFKIPRRIVFVSDDDIPRTTTGKLRLFDLAGMITERLASAASGEPTATEPTAGGTR